MPRQYYFSDSFFARSANKKTEVFKIDVIFKGMNYIWYLGIHFILLRQFMLLLYSNRQLISWSLHFTIGFTELK